MPQTRMGSPQKGNPGRIQPLDFIHKVLGSFLSSRRAARKSFLPFPRNRAGRNVVPPLPFGTKGPPIGDALGPICVEHRTAPVDQPTVSIQPDDIDIAGKHGYAPSVEVLAQATLKPAIDFTSRYSSRPNFPHSRPLPTACNRQTARPTHSVRR